jgi:flagellar P-ring protein precursor FlgI
MRTRQAYQRDLMSVIGLIVALMAVLAFASPAHAQDVRIRDLTVQDRAVPVRLMGYGLVVGLDNTGDRITGGKGGGMTVNSVVNLLRRFDIEVPSEVVRMRNVAAVLVTAEVSPYLRPGGSFEVHVSSVGDARSLRGGVLWMTPLLADVGGKPMGSAQGAVLTTDLQSGTTRAMAMAENSARIPTGGLLEADLPHPKFASIARLVLRDPDVGTASRIASAINKEMGDTTAHVEDPGSVALVFKDNEKQDRATLLSRIGDVRVRPDRPSRLIIDGRDGTVVAGGDIGISDAVVTHAGITLSVGPPMPVDTTVKKDTTSAPVTGGLHVLTGTPAYRVAAALHAMKAAPSDIAAIFEALRSVGALSAEVVIR